ncbi:MAG: hypothetical protein ACYDDI_12090, partial [Candidatus Acidiferrales bacterium]
RDPRITITPESVIIFPRNPDHDHPGIAITIVRNLRSPSPGIPSDSSLSARRAFLRKVLRQNPPPKISTATENASMIRCG